MKNSTVSQLQATASTNEKKAIGKIESYYLRFNRGHIYVALEEVDEADFFWGRTEFREFQRLWKKKVPLAEIAETLERTEFAVLILSLDLLMRKKIKPRKGWKIW